MPAGAAFCPGCGRSMKTLASAERLAAAGGYFTLVPAVVLLFLPAFRSSSFVRFHAWQSIFLWGVFFLASLIGILLSNIAAAIVLLLLGILGSLAMFFSGLFCPSKRGRENDWNCRCSVCWPSA